MCRGYAGIIQTRMNDNKRHKLVLQQCEVRIFTCPQLHKKVITLLFYFLIFLYTLPQKYGISQIREVVSHKVHTLEIAGSIPASASKG